MKIWRLVSGILSMVSFLIITFQSCAVGLFNAVEDNKDDTSGAGGILVAFGLLVAGIVATVLWRNKSKGGDIALLILYGLTALMGFANQGTFSDLVVWSSWALICAIMAAVALIINSKNNNSVIQPQASYVPTQMSTATPSLIPYCTNCGAIISEGSSFCGNCGREVPKVPLVQQPIPNQYVSQLQQQSNTPNNTNTILLYTLIGLVVLALIGGGWYLWNLKKNDTTSKETPENINSSSFHSSVSSETTQNESNGQSDNIEEIDGYNKILSDRRLSEMDLESKTKKELEIMRNSIYARYGYRFRRDDLFNHFSQYSWYHPTTSDMSTVYNSMSDIEKYNIDFIKKHE